jgi:hypothetical protein
MNAKIKFNRPLPLVVTAPDNVYEIWVDYGETSHAWSVAVGRLGDRVKRPITVGKSTREELEKALIAGVELIEDPAAHTVACELVTQKRAEFVQAA